jgi:PAS domain S-box-containing protein
MRHTPADAGRLIQISLLGEAIEFLPVAVFVFDETGRYVAVNEHASAITGYPRDELLKMRLGQLADDPAEAIATYRGIAEGDASEGETRVRRKDGTLVEIHFRGGETRVGGMPFYVGVAWEAA